MNWQAINVIYKSEMLRTRNTLLQSIASPVISTCLYFVVFGSAIGSRIQTVGGVDGQGGVSYGVFICLLYTSPSPRDGLLSRMPSSA